MTITIGIWIIPALFSLACLGMMLRPYQRSGDYDFGQMLRILWIIPILIIWLIHFGILLIIKK